MILFNGILEWLITYDNEARERIINNTEQVVKDSIERHSLICYDNSLNRLSDIFDLVFSYVKIDIAPDGNSTEQDIADYNSLMVEGRDLPLIVYRCVKNIFKHPTHSKEDVKYCENFIENYRNILSYKK